MFLLNSLSYLSVNAGAGCAAPDDAPSAVSDPDADPVADADDDDDAAADDDSDADSDADSDDASAEAFGAALASPLCGTSVVRDPKSRCVRTIDISAFSFATQVMQSRPGNCFLE